MTDIVQLDHGQISRRSSHAGGAAHYIDARLLLLPALSLLSFVTAVLIATYTLLRRIFPQLNLVEPSLLEAINWPPGLTTFRFVAILFLLLALALYLVARRQTLQNMSVQASAGCPACQEHQLLRVSRTKRDRIFTISGVRVARYQCRECQWNGRRIFIKSYHPMEEALAQEFANIEVLPKPDLSVFATAGTAGAEIDEIAAETAVTNAPPAFEPVSETGAADAVGVQTKEALTAVVKSEDETELLVSAPEDNQPLEPQQTCENREPNREHLLNPGEEARVMTTFGVNLRAQPRSDANWIGSLGPETAVKVNRSQQQDHGTVWYHVSVNGQSGWVTGVCLEQPTAEDQ